MSWLLTVKMKEIKLGLIVVPTDDWRNLELGGNPSIEDSDSHATNINSGGRNRQITLRRGKFEDRIDVRAPIRTLRRGGNDASISQHQISASDKKRHY
jgi:hypothetical protein